MLDARSVALAALASAVVPCHPMLYAPVASASWQAVLDFFPVITFGRGTEDPPMTQSSILALVAVVAATGAVNARESASSNADSDPSSHRVGEARQVDLGGGTEMQLMWVPPGEFLMGSPDHRDAACGPQHKVTITQGFWMGKYEVTFLEYSLFLRDQGRTSGLTDSGSSEDNAFDPRRHKYPVHGVSWQHAADFCRWLSSKAGLPCRLPTEAEWEYACRAGTRSRYCSGDDKSALVRVAWCEYSVPSESPHAVGLKEPNSWGLHDMHGNVSEWCYDRYGAYPSGSVVDPWGRWTDISHVVRGGRYDSDKYGCESSARGCQVSEPNSAPAGIGFRVVCGGKAPERTSADSITGTSVGDEQGRKPGLLSDRRFSPLAAPSKPLARQEENQFFVHVFQGRRFEVAQLYQALYSSLPETRAVAARELGKLGDASSVPRLIDALSDPSGDDSSIMNGLNVRYQANESLYNLTGKDFGFVWNDSIEKRNEAIVRWRDWFTSRAPTFGDTTTPKMPSSSPAVPAVPAKPEPRTAAPAAAGCRHGEQDAGLEIGAAGVMIQEGPLEQWILQLSSFNGAMQRRAAQVLVAAPKELHGKIIPPVVSVLHSTGREFYAAQVLGECGPAANAAVPDLVALLARPLVANGTSLAPPEQWMSGHAAAARALGQILRSAEVGAQVSEVTKALIRVFDDTWPDARREAVTACGMIGPAAKDAVPAIRSKCLTSPDSAVRKAAEEALIKIERR